MKNIIFVTLFIVINAAHAHDRHPDPRAWDLAVQALMHNIVPVERGLPEERDIVLAGANQFRTTWSWDFAFASAGIMAIGRANAVRDTLQSYFEFQRADGLLPRTLDNIPIELRVLLGLSHINRQFKGPLKPWYVSENKVVSPIPNLTLVWAAGQYTSTRRDRQFGERWYEAAKKAVDYIAQTFNHDGLIGHQAPFSDWEDSLRREGRVAFTNLMYLRALRSLSDWAHFLGNTQEAKNYQHRWQEHRRHFLAFFWDDARAIVRNFESDNHLSADAQYFAIADGVLTREQALRNLSALQSTPINLPMPGLPTWPKYDNKMKSFFVKIGGMKDYHDGLHWGWLTAQAAMAHAQVGQCEQARTMMHQLAQLYVEHDEVGEVYVLSKKKQTLAPVKRWRYRSEAPFTWASGMYIEAVRRVQAHCS